MSDITLHDDLGELRDLACQVFAAAAGGVSLDFAATEVTTLICGDYGWPFWWHLAYWPEPEDKAAQLIAAWRAELDGESS